MIVRLNPSALREIHWYQYAIRFVLGGAMTVTAGLIAARFGPVIGGLFLAFPSIFPATATLIEKHVRERKEKVGLPGGRRGKEAAALDAAGAILGSFGLAAFALVIWQLIGLAPALALGLAMAAWVACAVFAWRAAARCGMEGLAMAEGLLPFPLTARSVHLCLDMQRLFSAAGPWPMPWMDRVLPAVAELAGRYPDRTVFTRFIPPEKPEQMPGVWQSYYVRWRVATRECLDPALLELMPPLAALCPPATIIDKTRYSAFAEPGLLAHLRERQADALIITGSETDVCVLATVLGAVDLGYRVIVVRDALCSSSDEGHDMLMRLYHTRFTEQIETADAETVLSQWRGG